MYDSNSQIYSSMGSNFISTYEALSRVPEFDPFMGIMPCSSLPSYSQEDLHGSGCEEDFRGQQIQKRKRNHRHTAWQISELEALFKQCPHPDETQRKKLSEALGLKPRQVKFWFQNRRTQMKAQQDRVDNAMLRTQNDNLRNENYHLQAVLRSVVCGSCGLGSMFEEFSSFNQDELRIENARLKEEFDRLVSLTSIEVGVGDPILQLPKGEVSVYPNGLPNSSNNLILSEDEKSHAFRLAESSASELIMIAKSIEGRESTAVVIMNSITLVESFIDVGRWVELFPSIVRKGKTIQVLTSGNPTQMLQSMYAELEISTPLVPTRECYFLRYCCHCPEDCSWVIVDFHHDGTLKRKPSGCIISDMPNGYSKVTWVDQSEHEVSQMTNIHPLFAPLVNQGLAFNARRWLCTLQRQCERLASFMARNISGHGVIPTTAARKSLMSLSQRMVKSFCGSMSAAGQQPWTSPYGDNEAVRMTTRKERETGQPNGLVLSVASSTWLPCDHSDLLDLFKDERLRSQLDVVLNGNTVHEIAHIANGSHPGNCVSLFRLRAASNSSQNIELIVQESCTDDSGSMIVYASVTVDSIQMVMNGEDSSCIPILPLGFVTMPMPPSSSDSGPVETNPTRLEQVRVGQPGCVITGGIQVLASPNPSAALNLPSVSAINNHLENAFHQIGEAVRQGTATADFCSRGSSGGDDVRVWSRAAAASTWIEKEVASHFLVK